MSRLDRMEHLMELLISDHVQFREEHKQLLTAQVVLTATVEKLATSGAEFRARTEQNLAEITDKLNGLIGFVAG